ncbi:MAG: hypothetical protein NT099_03595 [Candidatus Saganbacteria bacterium]|nr:hypothetical protein [Candidatus Saganbacteria bacterium]
MNKFEALDAARNLTAARPNPAPVEVNTVASEPKKVVDSGMPIVAQESRPPIKALNTGKAIADVIEADPIASKFPPEIKGKYAQAILASYREMES